MRRASTRSGISDRLSLPADPGSCEDDRPGRSPPGPSGSRRLRRASGLPLGLPATRSVGEQLQRSRDRSPQPRLEAVDTRLLVAKPTISSTSLRRTRDGRTGPPANRVEGPDG
jgi:hypothetical protein